MEVKRKRNTETSKSSTNSTKLVPECGLLRKTFQDQIIDNASEFMSEKEDAKVRFDLDQPEEKPKSKFGKLGPKRGILKLNKFESCEVRDSEERTPCDINLSMYGLTTTNDGSEDSDLSPEEDNGYTDSPYPVDNMFKLSEEPQIGRKSTAKFGGK